MIDIQKIKRIYAEREPEPIGKHRFFSVLVPFVEKDGKIQILFEVRAKKMKSQPGEVCFPGGSVEQDEDFCKCALRETYEEIGISEDKVDIIGRGDILYGYANYTLYPYLGVINYEDVLNAKLSADEVDEIFILPLDSFIKNRPEIYTENIYTEINSNFPNEKVGIDENYPWRVGNWEIPIFDVEGRIIWGLTARIIDNIIMTVL